MTIAIILYKSSTVVILNIDFRLKLSTNENFYYSVEFYVAINVHSAEADELVNTYQWSAYRNGFILLVAHIVGG